MSTYLPKIIGNSINFISYFSSEYAAKLAVKVFSTPRNGKLNKDEESYLDSAIQKNITYKGFTLKTYLWSGEKQTILLAHGWDSNSFRWKDLIELLKVEEYNIIAIDA